MLLLWRALYMTARPRNTNANWLTTENDPDVQPGTWTRSDPTIGSSRKKLFCPPAAELPPLQTLKCRGPRMRAGGGLKRAVLKYFFSTKHWPGFLTSRFCGNTAWIFWTTDDLTCEGGYRPYELFSAGGGENLKFCHWRPCLHALCRVPSYGKLSVSA